jgi:hypothetical protein
MPIEHVIYIPGVLLLGLVLGYVLGARASRGEAARDRERARR